jgi:hypothetical protein
MTHAHTEKSTRQRDNGREKVILKTAAWTVFRQTAICENAPIKPMETLRFRGAEKRLSQIKAAALDLTRLIS